MNGMSEKRRGWRGEGERGYTIVEMMTVLIIIGIATAMAVGSYSTAVPQSRLREATTELHSLIGLARVMAMSQNATVTLKLSGTGQALSGSDVTMSGSYSAPITVTLARTVGGVESLISTQAISGEITQLVISPGLNVPPVSPWIRYNSMGARAGTGAQLITLTNTKGRIYSIAVSPGGKAKWCITPSCS